MPIQFTEEKGGKLLVIHLSGKLEVADYELVVPECERLIRQHGKLSILFEMAEFKGWDAGALWEEIKFDIEHFADIKRVAMVGDKKVAGGDGDALQAIHQGGKSLFRHE